MDDLKEYIKMCAAAEEIQDYFQNPSNQKGKLICYCHIKNDIGILSLSYHALDEGISWDLEEGGWIFQCCDWSGDEEKITILPTQEQLQEICKGETIFEALKDFHLFVFTNSNGGTVFKTREAAQFTSAEQLWLAFLMYSTLQKRWDGEKWIKK